MTQAADKLTTPKRPFFWRWLFFSLALLALAVTLVITTLRLNQLATNRSLYLDVIQCEEQADNRLAIDLSFGYDPARVSWPLRLFASTHIYAGKFELPISFYNINEIEFQDRFGLRYPQDGIGQSPAELSELVDLELKQGDSIRCQIFLAKPERVSEIRLFKGPWHLAIDWHYSQSMGPIQNGLEWKQRVTNVLGWPWPLRQPALFILGTSPPNIVSPVSLVSSDFVVIPFPEEDTESPHILDRIRELDMNHEQPK